MLHTDIQRCSATAITSSRNSFAIPILHWLACVNPVSFHHVEPCQIRRWSGARLIPFLWSLHSHDKTSQSNLGRAKSGFSRCTRCRMAEGKQRSFFLNFFPSMRFQLAFALREIKHPQYLPIYYRNGAHTHGFRYFNNHDLPLRFQLGSRSLTKLSTVKFEPLPVVIGQFFQPRRLVNRSISRHCTRRARQCCSYTCRHLAASAAEEEEQ